MRPIAKCNRALQRKYIPLYGDMCVHLHSQKYPCYNIFVSEKLQPATSRDISLPKLLEWEGNGLT